MPDLLVQMGEYKTISEAHDAILQVVEIKDARVNDLDSLEFDDNLLLLDDKSVILMSFPEAIKLLHRLSVRTIAEGVNMPQIAVVAASEAVNDVMTPQIAAAVASEAVKDVIMPQNAVVAASEAIPVVPGRIRQRKVPASVLKRISGFPNLDDSCLEGKEVRQTQPGQVDEKDEDIGGRWVITDSVSACTGDKAVLAIQWVKKHINVIKKLAKSLTYIDSGHPSVSFTKLTKKDTNKYQPI